MTNFERVKYYFEKGWATVAQVQMYVQYSVITGQEFEQITGEPYGTGE
ncbi:XkdX family protein [Desulforamulus ruminis]|nr:XkdX family protein [Desulforamulus ruminis]